MERGLRPRFASVMKRKLTVLTLVLLALTLLVGAVLLFGGANAEPVQVAEPSAEPEPSPTPVPTPEPTPAPTPVPEYPAEQLALSLDLTDRNAVRRLLDDNYETSYMLPAGRTLTLSAERPIASVYIRFGSLPGDWTLRAGGKEIACGRDRFLHEYVRLNEPATSVELVFPEGEAVLLRDVFAFTEGYPPPFVQTWQNLREGADILVFVAHYDDELLFLGGLIPYYASVRGARVQVVYMTSNYLTRYSNYALRPHEALNGLWECGVHYYPVTNDVGDYYCDSYEDAVVTYGWDSFAEFQIEMIRRFKPLVVVTLAEDGEYGHGAHMLTAYSAERAVQAAADPAQFPDSAARYGLWDTPKTYLHRWGGDEDTTVLSYEQSAPELRDRTPFEAAQDAYAMHRTQQGFSSFYVYDYGHPYDSHRFGLYRSLVGPDEEKNDLMEHVSRDMFPAD